MPKNLHALVKTEAEKSENAPIFLLELELDDGTKYFTDSEVDINFPTTGGKTYTSWGFSFDNIRDNLTGEIERVRFSFDNTDLVFRGYLDTEEFQGRRLILKRVFRGEDDILLGSSAYSMTLFFGDMSAPVINQDSVIIQVYSPTVKFKRKIPRRKYQPNCQWRFDSTECLGGGTVTGDSNILFSALAYPDAIIGELGEIDFSDYGFDTGMKVTVTNTTYNNGTYTITGMDSIVLLGIQINMIFVTEGVLTEEDNTSATLTVSLANETTGTADADCTDSLLKDSDRTKANDAPTIDDYDNYWQTGFVEMTSGFNNGEKRMIRSSTTGEITLNFPFTNAITEGDTYTIKRGCIKTTRVCKFIYDNFENFGGFATLPQSLMKG